MKRERIVTLFIALFISSIFVWNASGLEVEELEYETLDIRSNISNHYHECNISAIISNPGSEYEQTSFFFFIPEDAMLTVMTVEIEGETYVSRVSEREQAQKEYTEAVEGGDSAFLLERSVHWNRFNFRIGLEPSSDVKISIEYGQILKKFLGAYDLEIDLGGISNYISFEEVKLTLTAGTFELKELKTERSTIDVSIDEKEKSGFSLSYSSNEPGPEDRLFITYIEGELPENGIVRSSVHDGEGYFLHIFCPEVEVVETYMPKDIVIVLDKSGSMNGQKIDTVKESFSNIIDQFGENDRFNLILFDTVTTSFRSSIVEADESSKAEAERFLDNIEAGGSTNIGLGLEEGIDEFVSAESKVSILLFLTDGLPTKGEGNTTRLREDLKNRNQFGAVVHTLGYGFDHDSTFLKALALDNEGEYRFIIDNTDSDKLLKDKYASVANPLLKNLDFQYSSNTYDLIGGREAVLFEGSEAIVLGKYDPSSLTLDMDLDATYQAGDISFEETYDLADTESDRLIPRLWAHSRIMQLLDEIIVKGEDESIRSKIIDLAIEFSFVTPYTSFILTMDDNTTTPTEGGPVNDGIGDSVDPYPNTPRLYDDRNSAPMNAPNYDPSYSGGTALSHPSSSDPKASAVPSPVPIFLFIGIGVLVTIMVVIIVVVIVTKRIEK